MRPSIDLIRTASVSMSTWVFGCCDAALPFSAELLASDGTAKVRETVFSTAATDVGAFISFSLDESRYPLAMTIFLRKLTICLGCAADRRQQSCKIRAAAG